MSLYFYNSTKNPISEKNTVFLAGPTEREKHHTDWRVSFINYILKNSTELDYYNSLNFYIPEFLTDDTSQYPQVDLKNTTLVDRKNVSASFSKEDIYIWERSRLRRCNTIIFWVDRNIKEGRLALTTNIEFGNFYSSGKCICGSPSKADKNDYLKWVWEKEQGQIWHYSFRDMFQSLVKKLALD